MTKLVGATPEGEIQQSAPELPPLRTFRVVLYNPNDRGPVDRRDTKEITVSAHSLDTTDGNLVFLVAVMYGPHMVSQTARGFAAGQWVEYEEVHLPAPSGIIH